MTAETAEELARYREVWTNALRTLRGWSDAQVQAWAQPLLGEDADLTLHEPPAFWLAPALIPDEVKARLDAEGFARFVANVQFALDGGDAFWAADAGALSGARRRLADALVRHAGGDPKR